MNQERAAGLIPAGRPSETHPMRCYVLVFGLMMPALGVVFARGDDPAGPLLKEIKAVSKEGAGSPAARSAWDRLVAQGPQVLPQLLDAMDTSDTVTVNWLGTAFDRIVEGELRAGGKAIDADGLLAFAKDPKRHGRARRLALEVVERLRPGTSARLIPGWLNDPEFRFEAVAHLLQDADALTKSNQADKARAAYRQAFAAARDFQQVKDVAAALHKAGVPVSAAEHLGFLMDWYVIGPFDALGMKGFKTVYPPEERIDLSATYPGQKGQVRWKRYQVKEAAPTTGSHIALVNLRAPEALGDALDAVGYAYTELTVPEAVEVEFRGAADDNLTVFVNGKREFGFEEYRNGVRLDRHRFRVKLKAGVNKVLVKVCQAPAEGASNEPNWEFLLRVVDATGKGIDMKCALPAEPKK